MRYRFKTIEELDATVLGGHGNVSTGWVREMLNWLGKDVPEQLQEQANRIVKTHPHLDYFSINGVAYGRDMIVPVFGEKFKEHAKRLSDAI